MLNEIMDITLPAFIELVMSTLFGMIDMMMVGQLSPAAITSVGLTNQPFMLLLAVFAAVNVGTTTLVAWNIGAQNVERARSVLRQILVINFILGAVMSAIGILLARPIVTFMGAGPDVMNTSTQYFQIVASGLIFQAVTMGITASLRGAGETKIPMLYNVGSNLLNVFGNYVLIYGKLGFPKWGVTGAGVSTTVSRMIACMAGLYVVYFSRKSIISMSLKGSYKFDLDIIKKVFSIGLPAALEQFVLQSGLMLFARTVSGLGTEGFAAHQIGLNISGLSFSPSMAFGVAATTFVGQNLGAGNEEKAQEYANFIHHVAMAVACFIGIMFILFSHPLARLYTKDLEVAAMAGTVLKILALAQPGQSTQLTLAGSLRGAGDTLYPLYASAIGIWGFRVIVAYLFVNVFGWGLIGAWVALVMDQYTRSLIVYFRFRSDKWKYVKARKQEVTVE
ncbi:MAG: MATE family efflux transporter [Firmicutes bacterium]|nr:MATE family efflux transporter [Bacillota bacterium]